MPAQMASVQMDREKGGDNGASSCVLTIVSHIRTWTSSTRSWLGLDKGHNQRGRQDCLELAKKLKFKELPDSFFGFKQNRQEDYHETR
jgi:hypothetical protein